MTAPRFLQAEVWSNLQCAADAQILAVIVDATSLSVTRSTTQQDQKISLTVRVSSDAYAAMDDGNVIVLQYDDGTSEEWRIVTKEPVDGSDGAYATVGAIDPINDLLEIPYLSQLSNGGTPQYTFGNFDFSPADYVNTYVVADAGLIAAGIPYTLGQIDPTIPLTLDFDHVTPMAALQQIATACTERRVACEIRLRKVGNTSYAIDLLSAIGEDADEVWLRVGTELSDLQEQSDSTDMTSVAMALGADNAKLSRAAWTGTTISSTVLQLSDPAGGAGPILVDGQLVGCALVDALGHYIAITASFAATQRVIVASTSGFISGDVVEVRANTAGDLLTMLSLPGRRVKFGTRNEPSLRGDFNVIPNAYQNIGPAIGTAAPATGWVFTGDHNTGVSADNATIVRTLPPAPTMGQAVAHLRSGTSRFTFNDDGGWDGTHHIGLTTRPSPWITTTTDAPAVSMQVRLNAHDLRINAGEPEASVVIQLERVHATPGVAGDGTYDHPVAQIITPRGAAFTATPFAFDTWVEFGLGGITLPASDQYFFRIYEQGAVSGALDFDVYIGEVQLTQTFSNVDWILGSGGNGLWDLANYQLAIAGSTPVQYTATQIPLARIDPEGFDYTVVSIGATCHVESDALSLAKTLRCVGITEDLIDPEPPKTLTLATQVSPLTKLIASSILQFQAESTAANATTASGSSSGDGYREPTFLQIGTGARTRTLNDKLRERISLLDYNGADTTGATASDDGVDVAFAVLELLGGGILFCPRGRYGFAREHEVPDNVIIVGDGMGVTTFFAFTTTRFRSFFFANNVARTSMRDLTIDMGQDKLVTYADYPTMYNVGFYGYRSSDMSFDRVEFKNLYTASAQFFQCLGTAKFRECMFLSPAQSQTTVINHIMVNTSGAFAVTTDDCDVLNDEPDSADNGVAFFYTSGQSGAYASITINNTRTRFCGRSKTGTHNLEVVTCYGDNMNVNITNSVFTDCLTQVVRLNDTWKATVDNLKATMAAKAVAGENMISIAGTDVYAPGKVGSQNILLRDLDFEDVHATDRIGVLMISYDWAMPIRGVRVEGLRGNGLKYATRIAGPHNGITLSDYNLRGANGNIIRIEGENSAHQVKADNGVNPEDGFFGNVTMRDIVAEHGSNGAIPVQIDFTMATPYTGTIGEYTIDTMTQRALAGSVAQALTWRGTTDHQTGTLNIRHATLDGYAHTVDAAHGEELVLDDVKSRNTSGTPFLLSDFGVIRRRDNTYSTGPADGRAVLVAGTVTVSTTEVVAGDNIRLTRDVAGGPLGHLSVGTIVAGTSFVINSSSNTETSTIFWEIVH